LRATFRRVRKGYSTGNRMTPDTITTIGKDDLQKYFATLSDLLCHVEVTGKSGEPVDYAGAATALMGAARQTHADGNKLMFVGNGGSAAIASHMATDYSKNGGVRSLALNDASSAGGTIIIYGGLSAQATPFPGGLAMVKGLAMRGYTLFEITRVPARLTKAKDFIIGGMRSGKFVPVIDRTFHLKDIAEAHRKAHACDPVSAYGGVIATNRPVDAVMAAQLADIFTEVIVAPAFYDAALDALSGKKNLRLLVAPPVAPGPRVETRPVSGGLLMQTADRIDAPGDDPANWTLAAGAAADDATLRDLQFAWRAIRAVKSNAILLADDGATVGIGMGQVNRVDSCRLAVSRAGERAAGSVGASDAFFPFADGLQVLIDAGVRAVVQPGGSIRDADVIEAAQAAGVTMYLTGARHFAH